MKTTNWTDTQLLEAIISGGQNRQIALKNIYDDKNLKNMVAAYVRNHQGNADDGQDMFHEGIIVFDRNVREGKFRGESPLKGYLYAICRFLWMNQLRKNAHTSLGTDQVMLANEPDDQTPEITLIAQERKNLLNDLLHQLGERCQQILELWKLSFSMEEIATTLGFSSPDMARKAKYRCQVSLIERLQQNPEIQKLLKY